MTDTSTSSPSGSAQYRAVPHQIDLSAMEHEVLELWEQQETFAASLDQTANGQPWTFYEGPPTANGMPGTHHVEARVFKDVFPRFWTMRGRYVERKAGWDCHGLPVELAVEKELGFTGKTDIEAFGIAKFNAHCRESVLRHVDAFEQMSLRMGMWVDTEAPYRTMDASYVESVWWALQQIYNSGLLVEDHRVAPYCPRCGTGLSDHELAQGYELITDPSVYVTFRLLDGPWSSGDDPTSLLVWTTTPWTLPSNTAIAVHPDVTYVLAQKNGQRLVIAEPLLGPVLGEGWQVIDQLSGREMEYWKYEPVFDLLKFPGTTHYVVVADYVTTEDGTGLVHQSPAFGQDDMQVAREYDLPVVNPVTADGHFQSDIRLVGGMFFRDANHTLVQDLQQRDRLFRHMDYEHNYPHCWRCHTALLYYAQPSWYIRTTAKKAELLRENEATNWFPDTVKWGRYGDWLHNNIDWALSRSRYWGTPLPIWRCEANHLTCIGSLNELSQLAGKDYSDLDPHRPFIDEVTFTCPTDDCGGLAQRVPEVIDAWFDSGAMPFAQWGYPHKPGSKEKFEAAYPADFICEAIDQTRGWFYTLMAVGTLVFDQSSYRNVLCLGHILAEDGRKMSKHLGNTLEPIPLMERHGADAIRWFMACSGSPWSARRIGHATISEIVRKVLLTYWNSVSFQVLYAQAANWTPGAAPVPAASERPVLDRWLYAETARLVHEVTTAYEAFDTQRIGSMLSQFIDDLSNWYVRRSRRRFWDGDPGALQTLHDTLVTLTQLLAPLVPFITERVWQDIVVPVTPTAAASVHLSPWPEPRPHEVDDALSAAVAISRRLVELGRAARAEAKVKTRQPLARALVATSAYEALNDELRAEVAAELNVATIEPLSAAGADLITFSAKGNFRALGKRFAQQTPHVAAAIAAADASALAAALRSAGEAEIDVDGAPVTVTAEEVLLSERPKQGWSVVNEQGETVALDLTLTPALKRAGLAREMIRMIQDARKSSGFDVSDRIRLRWFGGDTAAAAFTEHQNLIAAEVLATEVGVLPSLQTATYCDSDLEFGVSLEKVSDA